MPKIVLLDWLDARMCPEGAAIWRRMSIEEAREFVRGGEVVSYIRSRAAAEAARRLLGIEVGTTRRRLVVREPVEGVLISASAAAKDYGELMRLYRRGRIALYHVLIEPYADLEA